MHGHPSTIWLGARRPRFLPVRRPSRPGAVRGQGQIAPVPAQLLLPGPRGAARAHGPDGRAGRPRRMGGRRSGVGGAPPRAQPHPAAPTALQRAPQGRQELSMVGGHRVRRVAASGRGAGTQAQGCALLRSLSERGGHPPHPRPVAAVLSGADVQRQQVPSSRSSGPALPAVPHRALLGALRGAGRPRRVRPHGRQPHRLPVGRLRAGWSASCAGRCEPRPTPSNSSEPRCCGTGSRRCGLPTPSARWTCPTPRTSTRWLWPATTSRPPSRCSTCARARWSGARDCSWTRPRT